MSQLSRLRRADADDYPGTVNPVVRRHRWYGRLNTIGVPGTPATAAPLTSDERTDRYEAQNAQAGRRWMTRRQARQLDRMARRSA